MNWQAFLTESDAAIRRNEINRGLTYSPCPSASTAEAVAEYMDGFAWNGVGRREVAQAVQRDERGVARALHQLVDDGVLRVTETITRGPKASRRKVYHSLRERPEVESMSEHFDFYGSPSDRATNEHGCGGGREILPLRPDMGT